MSRRSLLWSLAGLGVLGAGPSPAWAQAESPSVDLPVDTGTPEPPPEGLPDLLPAEPGPRSGAEAEQPRPDEHVSPLALDVGPFLLVPSMQYRLRFRHFEGHDFTEGGAVQYLRHRARLGLEASWQRRLAFAVELQDVRTFGEETSWSSDYAADGFDVHQVYATVRPVPELQIRVGRQRIAFENERIVGKGDFSENDRSHDAVRITSEALGVRIDSFYSRVREDNAALGIAEGESTGRHLVGSNLHYDALPELGFGLLGTLDVAERQGKQQHTVGAIASGDIAKAFHYVVEGYYQLGAAYRGVHYSAFLFGAQARYTVAVPTKPFVQAHASFLSGDDEPDDRIERTFELPFAPKHRFYGEMDLFSDIAKDTGERGLRDLGATVGLAPVEGLGAQAVYRFLQPMASRPDELTTFGHELDVKVSYQFWTYARVDLLYAFFVPGDIFRAEHAEPIVEHFAYSTIDLKF